MRIGDFEDAVGKQLLARREGMNTDLARLGAKLSAPGNGAVSPAATVPDSVVLSAEARAAHLPPELANLPLPPFPSPRRLIAVMRELEASGHDAALSREAAGRFVSLLRSLAASLPPGARVPPGEHPAAEALVRAALGGAATPGELVLLVRRLLQLSSPDVRVTAQLPPSAYERAVVAVLASLLRLRPELPPASGLAASTLPPGLLSFLASPPGPRPRRPGRARAGEPLRDDPQDDLAEDSGRTYTPRNTRGDRAQ